jgi:mono/diheme cytochrome c family protein
MLVVWCFLSDYLADQVKKRDLDKNGGHRGRIWRIVPDGNKPGPMPKLTKAPVAELVAGLSSPLGWWRDTCQRLLVERQDQAAVPLLVKTLEGKDSTPLSKVHALWALQGLDKLDDDTVAQAAKDADARVRLAALRVGEVLVRKHTGNAIVEAMGTLANDPDLAVQLQVLMMASPDVPELIPAGNKVLEAHLSDPIFRSAALNGAVGRELAVLQILLTDKAFAGDARGMNNLLSDMAMCVIRSRSSERIEKLFDFIGAQPANLKAKQQAMLAGAVEAIVPPANSKIKTAPRRLRVLREPVSLTKLESSGDKKLADLAKRAIGGLSWPGKAGDNTPPLKPLTPVEQKRFAAGREAFGQICAQCHQPSGLGQEGIAPPLVDSEWALGSPERFARIALNGVRGPIKVGRRTVDLEMPGLYALDDEQIASMLTYVRREWGHEASPISPELVAKVLKESAGRGQAQWTPEELLQIK